MQVSPSPSPFSQAVNFHFRRHVGSHRVERSLYPLPSTSATSISSTSCSGRLRCNSRSSPTSISCFLLSRGNSFPSRNCSASRRVRRKRGWKIPGVSAVFERFTERAVKTVIFSQAEAKALGNDTVFTQHLLLGLIAEEEKHYRSPDGFLGSGITLLEARNAVRSIWHHISDDIDVDSENGSRSNDKVNSGSSTIDIPFSSSAKRVLEAAVEYSSSMRHHFIGPEHISLALFTVDDGSADRVLERLGADVNHLADVAVSRLQRELAKDGREPPLVSYGTREKSSSQKSHLPKPSGKIKEKNALSRFCVDLTARATDGRIDPVIGREAEVQRVVEILCRRTKNNPILLGESGVGKTAIAEGLALCISQLDTPVFLMAKRVMSLDVGLLIAGATERGELEARVTALISEILKSGDIILFIDEVHTLVDAGTVGRGNKGSGLDIANIMKPYLGRGKLQCIAATTMDEYRKHFEKDKALARRFQPVLINEPSQEEAVSILFGLRQKYETYHKCRFTNEAIQAAVYLSARYISDRYLPDKAIDLIDEAGSRARMETFKRRKELQVSVLSKSPDDYWQEIRAIQAMHEAVVAFKMKYDATSSFNDKSEVISEFPFPSISDDHELVTVGSEDIAAVASLWSGIPVKQLTADERMLLLGLDEQLRKRVVGQDEAVFAICRAVKRSRAGLKDPKRPVATILFCGPTGVGKTELAKALAACYFGSEAAMLRLDMSEYMEQHSVSKLIGSPPGYIGYGDGGTLTEAIRRRPFTLILFDEIEKAHPSIFNILLQLTEDGHLTDSRGRKVSFKNALILMTSNVGSTAIIKGRQRSPGFFIAGDESTSSYAGIKTILMEELKSYFRPELLNRIDEIIVFRPLQKDQMLEILNMMLEEVQKRLRSLGVGLVVSESVKDLICKEGQNEIYGARPLRRAVTGIIENPLSEVLLAGNYKPGDTFEVDLDDSGEVCVRSRSSKSLLDPDRTTIS